MNNSTFLWEKRPKVKTTIIKEEVEKNEKLLQRKRFEQFLLIIQAKYRQIKPFETDKLLLNHVSTAYIGPKPTSQTDQNAKKSNLLKFFHLVKKILFSFCQFSKIVIM